MDKRHQQIAAFFDDYEDRFNQGLNGELLDIDDTINSFTDCFVESSPVGVICSNKDDLRKKTPEGYAFYKKIGITAMNILAKEITTIDKFHTQARILWQSVYTKNEVTDTFEFDVIYFLYSYNEEHKIFSYITGDEQNALKKLGLV
jgi:hypothetical protein